MVCNPEKFQFIFIGNLLLMKGVMVLLDACSILKSDQYYFLCHIVGAPTNDLSLDKLHEYIHAKSLNDYVHIHGPLYGKDKTAILQKSNAMAFPTLDDCFPLVVLEAMQNALPVIASNEGAIPDMVLDGVTGILISKGNAEELANAMKRLITHPATARRMGEDGRARVLESFSQQAFISTLCDILRIASK